MKNAIRLLAAAALIFWPAEAVRPQQSRTRIEQPFAAPAKVTAPVVLCIDDKPQGGGQPSTQAYAKAAGNGFRSVLTLRSSEDGVDLIRERFMVEQSKMRYYNISASKSFPRRQQVDEFLSLVRDEANHPMLINCAFAERVAPYMMIFRVVEQGWNKSRAVEEAARSGLESKALRKFLDEYLTRPTKNHR
jgi:protein tyrosine phosphatase (PTP) superfamily phosphohydrolase (DUF442 family)